MRGGEVVVGRKGATLSKSLFQRISGEDDSRRSPPERKKAVMILVRMLFPHRLVPLALGGANLAYHPLLTKIRRISTSNTKQDSPPAFLLPSFVVHLPLRSSLSFSNNPHPLPRITRFQPYGSTLNGHHLSGTRNPSSSPKTKTRRAHVSERSHFLFHLLLFQLLPRSRWPPSSQRRLFHHHYNFDDSGPGGGSPEPKAQRRRGRS
ncbi:hypothetical protein BDY24DRAFT_384483 [Mrakia frigida]|uniref:uncharacterized protein n=1 Tax=Mrakia frigida TaxID=29902 RepID=UPI003FCC0F32